MVEEAVELRLGKGLKLNGNVITQLEERLEAGVRDELRRVETSTEQSPAIATQLGHEERGHRILSIGGDQGREARAQRQRRQA